MADRITETTCWQVLDRFGRLTGRSVSRSWGDRSEGALHLSSESGVKRLRRHSGPGVADVGPGFTSWRELYGFLVGLCEAEYLRQS